MTAGCDPQVGYWEPASRLAKIRSLSPSTRVLLRTEVGAEATADHPGVPTPEGRSAGHGLPARCPRAGSRRSGRLIAGGQELPHGEEGAKYPKGNETAVPLMLAANELGAPTLASDTAPVADTDCVWPGFRMPVKRTVPEPASVASPQHCDVVADMARV